MIVAVVAIVPMAAGMTSNFPLTTRAVSLDGWLSHVAPHLPSNQVVLTFPPPGVGGSTLAWQAVDRLHFAMATGAGPGDILARDGTEAPAEAILDAAATPLGRAGANHRPQHRRHAQRARRLGRHRRRCTSTGFARGTLWSADGDSMGSSLLHTGHWVAPPSTGEEPGCGLGWIAPCSRAQLSPTPRRRYLGGQIALWNPTQ